MIDRRRRAGSDKDNSVIFIAADSSLNDISCFVSRVNRLFRSSAVQRMSIRVDWKDLLSNVIFDESKRPA